MASSTHLTRMKKADLLSSLGAGVLGAGIALLLPDQLTPYAIPILLLGLISHSVGMFQKHGLEQQEKPVRIWWADALYWFCWLALAGLLIFIILRQF